MFKFPWAISVWGSPVRLENREEDTVRPLFYFYEWLLNTLISPENGALGFYLRGLVNNKAVYGIIFSAVFQKEAVQEAVLCLQSP